MNPDPKLALLVEELGTKHGCHTVILYGSRARGEENAASDYDVAGIRDEGTDVVRDARPWEGSYLDAFIYPLSKILTPDRGMLHMRRGVVLRQKGELGTWLLSRLQEIYLQGPELLSADEAEARFQWIQKTLERARVGDIHGNFRWAWLLTGALEDYFTLRGEWYNGPKEALVWLEKHQPELYAAFDKALKPGAPFADIEQLIRDVSRAVEGKIRTRGTQAPCEIVAVAAADAPEVRAFTEKHWGSEQVLARGQTKFPHTLSGFWAINGDRRLGLVTFEIAGDLCEIVTINNASPQKGVGSALLEATLEAARKAGCRRVSLITTNDNLEALRFYQKKNFSIAAYHRGAVDEARKRKPEIPLRGNSGIPIRDEIELELCFSP